MVKVLVSSCEYGDFHFKGHHDKTEEGDGYEIRSIVHTDKESLVTRNSMHPRMYGKINKMMNWVLYPGYDYYIWRDSRIFFKSLDCIIDLVCNLKKDVAFFNHRFNKSIEEELDHVLKLRDEEYIKTRYSMDVIQAQVDSYVSNGIDQKNHFECGLFVFSKDLVSNHQNNLMRHWFTETMMWSENDQISLPYSLFMTKTDYQILEGDVLKNKWTTSDYKGYK